MKEYPVITFWFEEISEEMWWKKDEAFDILIKKRFFDLHQAAVKGELYQDRETPYGRLQEIILLDQFSRNIFRGTSLAFAHDTQALVLSQEAIRIGAQENFTPDQKAFLYLPFMHSESITIHKKSLELFSEPDLHEYLEYEISHNDIIEKFGRYPHRNNALGRVSTEAELRFISEVDDF